MGNRLRGHHKPRFAALIMRIREPKTTALIFASDKMVVTGAKTQRDAWAACRKFSQTLQKPGFPTEIADFKIQNIVSSFDCKFPIRLEGIAVAKFGSVSYEPELIPGLVYRLQAPKVVVLIFASGKVVLTGAKSKDDISGAFDAIRPLLQSLLLIICMPSHRLIDRTRFQSFP
ncbi:Putative TATA-box binding protein [Colletotrichum destructivum]|uniref:TATA-box binding protein n=1 Tax=Colletotrichum destructivum TaxID=34406 RepID=A0AAX4J523_9PEZI|nr:Putative TATA-box binding protein [Colletotrichum destructivum]